MGAGASVSVNTSTIKETRKMNTRTIKTVWRKVAALTIAASAAIPMVANAADTEVSITTNGVTWSVVIDSSSRTATLGWNGCTSAASAKSYRACDVDTVATTDKIPWTFTHEGVDYTVTKVAPYAFWAVKGITGVLTIPDAVTTIGKNAFGNNVSPWMGFTGLKGLGGVTEIGDYAFQQCYNMVGEYPDLSLLTSVGESPFQNCTNMTGKLKLGESLSTIPKLAFAKSCFSGTAVVPADVTIIGQDANSGVFEQDPNLSAIWVKGKPDAASQTYTTVYCARFAASCSSMKMILMGKNTKGGRMTQTGSNAMLYGATGVQVFVPANGYWNGLVAGGTTNNKVWYYGPTGELDLEINHEWMQATITPTTVNALTNALAWVPAFKTHFNLDAHISVTNAIDLTDVTITDDMVSGVTFDRLMFSAKTQTQLDAILGKFPVTTPISIDPTGLTENMVVPDTYTNVYVKTVPGVTIKRTASGFIISYH